MTTARTAEQFLVLHALRIKGVASAQTLAGVTGLSGDSAAGIAGELLTGELARHRDGRMGGYSLTAAGKQRHAELLRGETEQDSVRGALHTAYAGFLECNGRFKRICTDWQMKPGEGEPVPNDHNDTAYDSGVIDELAEVHTEVVPVVDALAAILPRFGRYPERLAAALGRVREGEREAFAKPTAESYHDIWMELHQDLLTSSEQERGAHDEG